jgi:hypothetical protein
MNEERIKTETFYVCFFIIFSEIAILTLLYEAFQLPLYRLHVKGCSSVNIKKPRRSLMKNCEKIVSDPSITLYLIWVAQPSTNKVRKEMQILSTKE